MDETIQAVISMISEHPDLPVICMVQSEVVAEDNGSRWLAKVGDVYRAKVWIGEWRVYFYDEDDDLLDVLQDPACEASILYQLDLIDDSKVRDLYNDLPWQECIVLNIDTH